MQLALSAREGFYQTHWSHWRKGEEFEDWQKRYSALFYSFLIKCSLLPLLFKIFWKDLNSGIQALDTFCLRLIFKLYQGLVFFVKTVLQIWSSKNMIEFWILLDSPFGKSNRSAISCNKLQLFQRFIKIIWIALFQTTGREP